MSEIIYNDAGIPVIEQAGEYRALACLPPHLNCALPAWADAKAVLPRAKWQEMKMDGGVAIRDQGSESSCFPAGTRIRMADGSQRPIEKICLLDRVLTAEGNIGTVVNLTVRTEPKELLRLQLWGHRHLAATAEHPILTKRGYVAVRDLQENDTVALPKFLPCTNNILQTGDHVVLHRSLVRKRKAKKFAGVCGRAAKTHIIIHIPDIIHLTKGAGRIFGLFLAEGCTSGSSVLWTFNITEEHTLVAELVELLREEWGLEASVQRRPNNSINVIIFGKTWALLFEALCSNGAGNKKLHPDITSGPADFMAAILQGWLDGDGFTRRNTTNGVSISHDLTLSMFDIANATGKQPTIRYSQQRPSHGVKYRQPRWDLDYVTCASECNRYATQDTKHVWRKVHKIEAVKFSGPVYNFEVAGDNSYVAESIGVHNCTGQASASAATKARVISGQPLEDLSAHFVYGLINGGRDEGAVISDALVALKTYGIAPERVMPRGAMFRNQFPKEAFVEAKKNVIAEAYKLNSFDELCTALTLGFLVVSGILVDRDFGDLDGEGIAPVAKMPIGGHALAQDELHYSARRQEWCPGGPNSWGTRFGMNGRYRLVEAHWQRRMPFDAFAIQLAADNPDEDHTDPPVVS